MKDWSVLIAETSFERSSLAEFNPRPLIGLSGHRIDAEEKHLHTLFARNFNELDGVIRREIKVQLTQIRTDLQRTDQKTIDRDAQLLRLVFVCLSQTMSKLPAEIA